MKSKTKYEVTQQVVKELFEKAEIFNIENISPLGAGEFNTVYSAHADGVDYVVKIAPAADDRILTYEKNLMEQEIYYYSLMKEDAKIRVPKVYFWDFSHSVIPSNYFIMERMTGTQLDKAELSEKQKASADKKLAAMAASMHSVKGEKFGYRQNGLHDDWYSALKSMTENLMKDCNRLKCRTKKGAKLLLYIEKNEEILKKVESTLINFDIWPPNIFVNAESDDLSLSWIDPERCMWGDRIADFVCFDFMNMNIAKKHKILNDYNEAADNPISIGKDEEIRFALMLGYLGLIMEVEKHARYSIFNFGYWRNVLASKMLYKNAFSQLEKLAD